MQLTASHKSHGIAGFAASKILKESIHAFLSSSTSALARCQQARPQPVRALHWNLRKQAVRLGCGIMPVRSVNKRLPSNPLCASGQDGSALHQDAGSCCTTLIRGLRLLRRKAACKVRCLRGCLARPHFAPHTLQGSCFRYCLLPETGFKP